MCNKLARIPRNDWPKLRDLYVKDWPNNHVGYYTIDNFIRWTEFDPNIQNLQFYSLDGDWSDGTFLIVDRYQLFLNSLNSCNNRLIDALNLLDWKHSYKVSSFLERHRGAVLSVVEAKKLVKEYDNLTVLYYLPRSKASKFEISHPDDIIFKPMSMSDATTADDFWSNKHQGSLFLLQRLIQWNINIGAYTKEGNELVAWCFRLQAGSLGALEVKDSQQRRGLGTTAVKIMTKLLAEMGHDTFALANEKNAVSRRLFEKLGFELLDNAYWLKTYALEELYWTDE